MEYNINSFGLQYNRFANFTTNPYFGQNFVSNSVVNQTSNQCFQCSDQPFIRTLLPPNVNSCHIQSTCNPKKLCFQKQSITTSTIASTSKHSSNFTIDSILDNNNKNTINSENSSTHSSQSNNQILDTLEEDKSFNADNEKTIYNWLRCTRYKPPKVKKRTNSAEKRKAINRGPRIPFTSCQIRELENKFRETHYLSSLEVTYLAQKLNLTDSRIRIWFQNRRARDKREKRFEDSPKHPEEGEELVVGSSAAPADCMGADTKPTYLMDQQKKAPLVLHESLNTPVV